MPKSQRQEWGKVGVYPNDQPERFRSRTVPGPVSGVDKLPTWTTFVSSVLSPIENCSGAVCDMWRWYSSMIRGTWWFFAGLAGYITWYGHVPHRSSATSSRRTFAALAISRGTFCFKQLSFDVAGERMLRGSWTAARTIVANLFCR